MPTTPRQEPDGDGPDPRYAAVVGDAPLAYVSDYLSFVGADRIGRVCFALDTNRGWDADPPQAEGLKGERLQAEHAYAVLHDEHTGWIPQRGVTRYPHPGPDATVLPDSEWFTWTGSAGTGWTLRSEPNDLGLVVEPLVDRSVSSDTGGRGTTLVVMRSAAAVLRWPGRTVTGRVIHEGLASTAMNMLTRRTFSGLGGLEFLYLAAGEPAEAAGDVYLQKTTGEGSFAGMPPLSGFAAPAGTAHGDGGGGDTTLHDLTLDTTGHALAVGAFRWPTRWRGGWQHAGPVALAPTARVQIDTVSRHTVGRYGIAGFAMAVVSGTLTSAHGDLLPLYGFGELLAGGPVMHALARRGPNATSGGSSSVTARRAPGDRTRS